MDKETQHSPQEVEVWAVGSRTSVEKCEILLLGLESWNPEPPLLLFQMLACREAFVLWREDLPLEVYG